MLIDDRCKHEGLFHTYVVNLNVNIVAIRNKTWRGEVEERNE